MKTKAEVDYYSDWISSLKDHLMTLGIIDDLYLIDDPFLDVIDEPDGYNLIMDAVMMEWFIYWEVEEGNIKEKE